MSALKGLVSVALLALLLSRVDAGRLWNVARTASIPWLAAAIGLYVLMVLVSAWRWGLLLGAQGIVLRYSRLAVSFLVACFFNNFLPSNIGGDVVRVADTAPAAGSKTLATTVVLLDRGIGLLGLVLIAAVGATTGSRLADGGPVAPAILWAGFCVATIVAAPTVLRPQAVARLLHPLRVFHPAWVDERLARFGKTPGALVACFVGAVIVQAVLVAFYLAIAYSMRIPIGFWDLAVIVPITFIVQMIPVSMNGFGVREATFGFYFARLGLPLESALLLSFMGAALIMLVSLSGGAAYVMRNARVQAA